MAGIYDLTTEVLSELEIKENNQKAGCFIRHKQTQIIYSSFILDSNSRTKVCCDVSFYRSSKTGKYLPRLNFKKTNLDNTDKTTKTTVAVNINLTDGVVSTRFQNFINFLNSFKNLVDTGEFERSFKVVGKDFYVEFSESDSPKKISVIKELIKRTDFSTDEINSILFESRKKTIKAFLFLLKNKTLNGNKSSYESYIDKYKVTGEEGIWHDFFKRNEWLLGLNIDLKFIRDFISEGKVGIEDTSGKGSPKADYIGISNYTTLVELKTSNTKIFKERKGSLSRANTWDFSPEFIEGISQCLGQKMAFEKKL